MSEKSGKQVQQGKALEFACLEALKDRYKGQYSEDSKENIEDARKYFNSPDTNQNVFIEAAYAAVNILDSLEPNLSSSKFSPLGLKLQSDAEGKRGDVRDIVCYRKGQNWEIGLSCKHDNDDAKHSRLSWKIDFAKEWFGQGHNCSQDYFDEINPVFDLIEKKIKENEEKGIESLWSTLENKEVLVYVPLLTAFINEMNRLNKKHDDIPAKFVEYVLGKKDFYKIITNDRNRSTTVQAFNLKGTLGKKSEEKTPLLRISKLKLPTKFDCIEFKTEGKNKKQSKTTIRISCDEGWSFYLRLHNARSKIEKSLKFAIKILGNPSAILMDSKEWKPKG